MMNKPFDEFLINKFSIDQKLLEISEKILKEISEKFSKIDEIADFNQAKVLYAMQKNRLSDIHFAATTGYGYNDLGRDTLEKIYADVFNAESAIVRPQIISGTHALTVALFGNLRHGDELISVVGKPYDTLESVIGANKNPVIRGSLVEHGVRYNQVELTKSGEIDFKMIEKTVSSSTKMVTIQRSKGYAWRKSLTLKDIENVILCVKNVNNKIICMVDNCYGEFVDVAEPCEVGADLCVGSLIKNPGGGLAPVGGYIVGREEFVENSAFRLTSPGLGREVGPTLGVTPQFTQGLFLAPNVVASSMKTAIFAAKMFENFGFLTEPKSSDARADIVQAIALKNVENVLSFCEGIQKSAPVDSFVVPKPWAMPGYDNDVIMAAGAFIQGSSIELSADAPIKPPYAVYMQGGLTFSHGKIGVLIAINNMINQGLIKVWE